MALLAGGLRRPFSVDAPLTDPASFEGITFQSFESDLAFETARALGARPTTAELDAGLQSGEIQAFEKQFSTVIINGTNRVAPYVAANVVLWPETIAVVADAQRMGELSDRQRAWVDEAAAIAAATSVANLPSDVEQFDLFCAAGGRAGSATDAALAKFRTAVTPVYEQLRTDPATAAFIDEITRLKATISPVSLQIPAGCTGTAVAEPAAPASPNLAAQALEGVYRWELTAEDAEAAGQREDPRYPWPHVFTLTLDGGRWSHHVRDAKQEADYGGGPYSVDGDHLTLVWDDGNSMEFTFTDLGNGDLRVSPAPSLNAEDKFVLTTHEWTRIG